MSTVFQRLNPGLALRREDRDKCEDGDQIRRRREKPASSSAYTTPESSGASPDELNSTVLDASQVVVAADEAKNPYALEESLSASRPSLASTSSSITSNETSLADVFDYNSSWDREILTAADDDPLFANGHVVEMIVNRSGVLTEVKRSARNKQPPK